MAFLPPQHNQNDNDVILELPYDLYQQFVKKIRFPMYGRMKDPRFGMGLALNDYGGSRVFVTTDRSKIPEPRVTFEITPNARREGHSALRFNKETKKIDVFDPNACLCIVGCVTECPVHGDGDHLPSVADFPSILGTILKDK